MKLQSLLLTVALAQGLLEDASAAFHKVKINNTMPKSKGRKLYNFQCTLMIKAVMYGEGFGQHVEEIPECHLEGATLPTPLINMPSWLSEKFVNLPRTLDLAWDWSSFFSLLTYIAIRVSFCPE